MKYLRLSGGQIKAAMEFTLSDGRTITQGTLGGIIDSPRNLAQSGNCWIFPGSVIQDGAYVSGNAIIDSNGIVSDNARVYGNAVIQGGKVNGEARVLGDAIVKNNAEVGDAAKVYGTTIVTNGAKIFGTARVLGGAIVDGGIIKDKAVVMGNALVKGLVQHEGRVTDCVFVDTDACVEDNAKALGCVKLMGTTNLGQNAIVTGDHELVDEVIEDASLATNCPDKVPQTNVDCCTTREAWLIANP